MNKNKKIVTLDFIVNACLPILMGILIYKYSNTNNYSYIRNYLPDALWAYALVSAIFIIWNRKVNYFWLLVVIFFFVGYEICQYLHFINGTGDALDVITYFIATIIAIFINRFIKQTFYTNNSNL